MDIPQKAVVVHRGDADDSEIIAAAGDSEVSLLTGTVDRERSERVRQIWPFLRDRRIDQFENLTKRFID